MDLNMEVKWFSDTMKTAYNQSMPRIKPGRRKAVVWWTDEINELRQESIRARRIYLRARKNDAPLEETKSSWIDSQMAQHKLAAAIRKTKAKAWDVLIEELSRDPWGAHISL